VNSNYVFPTEKKYNWFVMVRQKYYWTKSRNDSLTEPLFKLRGEIYVHKKF